MSVWGDLDDDVVGPEAISGVEEPVEEADEEHDADFDVAGDGVFDPTKSVRVWLDADGRLVKCAISNKWRKRAKDSTLSERFADAFTLARASIPATPSTAYPLVTAPGPLTWDILDELADQAAALGGVVVTERDPHDEQEPERAVGLSDNRAVRVVLDVDGATEEVVFDGDFLASASIDELAPAVEQAHRAAYERFVPSQQPGNGWGQLADANVALAVTADAYLRHPQD